MSLPGLGTTMFSSFLTLQGTSARSRDFVPVRSERWRKVPREDTFSCVWIDNYISSIWYLIYDTCIDICMYVYIYIDIWYIHLLLHMDICLVYHHSSLQAVYNLCINSHIYLYIHLHVYILIQNLSNLTYLCWYITF